MAPKTPLDTFREDRLLAESMVIATRPVHAKLNKLIVSRLPLALPPFATDSQAYASGMMHIAPIFATFESEWSAILDQPDPSTVSQDLLTTLQLLHLPGLMRTDRLEADVQSMMGWTRAVTREQLDRVSKTGHLKEFLSHIRRAVKSKPHVLMSYSYILFMALFAGGRFVRTTLEAAGEEFWQRLPGGRDSEQDQQEEEQEEELQQEKQEEDKQTSSSNTSGLPLRLFQFDTPQDGEDLKRDFKQRLAEAEKWLSCREKHDVVQEAICIFENLVLVVAQVDDVVAEAGIGVGAGARDASRWPSADRRSSADSLATVITKPTWFNRFRDSVAVTKERSARRSSQEVHDRRRRQAEGCLADEKTTPALTGGTTLPSRPDNHPIVGSGDAECPAAAASSKSVRFKESLPQRRSQSHLGAGDPAGDVAEGFWKTSRRLPREQITNWIMGVAIGFIILGALLGRRVVSY
ncbi:hypothetical protein E4U55_001283 [Claviceps digitariae]|nr:hypothetical protein E4U55_001283 [Claviceps digitariae]